MCGQTLQLAVNYIDRYLSRRKIKRAKLQLVGVSCMLAASKFEEIWPPGVDDFVFIADHTYPDEEVKRMERSVLHALDFHLVAVTPHQFFKTYMLLVKSELSKMKNYDLRRVERTMRKININGRFLQELSMQQPIYLRRLPSEIAAMTLWLARRYEELPGWTEELAQYSGYSVQTVQCMTEELHTLLTDRIKTWRAKSTKEHTPAILNKYKKSVLRHKLPSTWPLTQRPSRSWQTMVNE